MIDVQDPVFVEIPKQPSSKIVKVFILGAAVIATLSVIWLLWVFLSPSRTFSMKEGSTYEYRGYKVSVINVTAKFCPSGEDQNCAVWLNENGVQISYQFKNSNSTSFAYLGIDSQSQLDLAGLTVELLSVNLEKKVAKIKFTQK